MDTSWRPNLGQARPRVNTPVMSFILSVRTWQRRCKKAVVSDGRQERKHGAYKDAQRQHRRAGGSHQM